MKQQKKDFYTLTTGRLSLFRNASKEAAKLMGNQEGFIGVHIEERTGFLIWFFDTLNNAKKARNIGEAQGIQFADHIMYGHYDPDGVPCIVDIEQ